VFQLFSVSVLGIGHLGFAVSMILPVFIGMPNIILSCGFDIKNNDLLGFSPFVGPIKTRIDLAASCKYNMLVVSVEIDLSIQRFQLR